MICSASIGTGWIAGEFIKATCETKGLCYTDCYSRNRESGEKFAQQWRCKKVYTGLAEMAENDKIDAVYIDSPNSFHDAQHKKTRPYGSADCSLPAGIRFLLRIHKKRGKGSPNPYENITSSYRRIYYE